MEKRGTEYPLIMKDFILSVVIVLLFCLFLPVFIPIALGMAIVKNKYDSAILAVAILALLNAFTVWWLIYKVFM